MASLEETREEIEIKLTELSQLFAPEVKVNFIAVHGSNPNAHLFVGASSLEETEIAIAHLRARGNKIERSGDDGEQLSVGDRVEVLHPGLAQIRKFAPAGAKPNNEGVVAEIQEDGAILVEFPIGDDDPREHSQVAPYPPEMVRKLSSAQDEQSPASYSLLVDGKRCIIRQVTTHTEEKFEATYKGHWIYIYQDTSCSQRRRYGVEVTNEEGQYAVYQWIDESECPELTMEGAIAFAIRGASLVER